MNSFVWISKAAVLAMHDEQLVEHGGRSGIRDMGLLESALARPENLLAYDSPDLADLAAAYAHGIGCNHAFVDGNKRASLVTTEAFLILNGFELTAGNSEIVVIWEDLAAGRMSQKDIANWIRLHLKSIEISRAQS